MAPLVQALAARWMPIVTDLAAPAAPSVDTILQAATADPWTLGGVIATVARDAMIAVLTAQIEALYVGIDPATCIALAERPARLQELRTKLFAAERGEEEVIAEARRAGMMLDRRGDADPAAVLSVVDGPAAA